MKGEMLEGSKFQVMSHGRAQRMRGRTKRHGGLVEQRESHVWLKREPPMLQLRSPICSRGGACSTTMLGHVVQFSKPLAGIIAGGSVQD